MPRALRVARKAIVRRLARKVALRRAARVAL